MAFNQGIFPTSTYGQLSESYGAPTYPLTGQTLAWPQAAGFTLGQGWLLFDFTVVNLLKCFGAIAANAACMFQAGNSNFYTVIPSVVGSGANVGTSPVTAINDRGGTLSVSGGINWMTTQGLATCLVAASQTASTINPSGVPMGSSSVAGQLTGVGAAGTTYYNNVLLINSTTTAGAYPVQLQ